MGLPVMVTKITINSDRSFEEGVNKLAELYAKKRFLRVTVVEGPDRSGAQNDTFYHVYELIAEWFHEGDLELARAECKLNYGLPILRRGAPDLDAMCVKTVDRLDYQEQLRFIKTMDVTSLFSMGQGTEYLKTILDTYAEMGIIWPAYLTKERNKPREQ